MSDRFKWLEMDDDNRPEKKKYHAEESDSYEVLVKRAFNLIVKGDLEKALKYYSRAIDYDERKTEPWVKQIWILIQLNEITQALTWTKKALQKFPKCPELLSLRALIGAMYADFKTAMAYADNANSQKGLSPLTQILRGGILLLQGGRHQRKSAERCIMKGLEGNQQDWWLQVNAGLAYLEAGYSFNAMEYFNNAKTLKKSSALIYYFMSKSYMAQGNFKKAREMIKTSLEIYPYFELGKDYQEKIEENLSITNFFKRLFGKKKL